jgi:hypothetical protein
MRGLYQIDHFITSNSIGARIMDTKRVEKGEDSDHSTIKLKLCIKVSLEYKKKYKVPRKTVPDWDLLKEPKHVLAFQIEIDRLLAKMHRKTLNSAIMEAAKATIPCCICNREDWFKMSKTKLAAAILARTKAFSKLSINPTNATRQAHLQKQERP